MLTVQSSTSCGGGGCGMNGIGVIGVVIIVVGDPCTGRGRYYFAFQVSDYVRTELQYLKGRTDGNNSTLTFPTSKLPTYDRV